MFDLVIKGQTYLFLIIFVMMIAGMIKENNLFADVFSFFKESLKFILTATLVPWRFSNKG